jgi:methyl halide transferase
MFELRALLFPWFSHIDEFIPNIDTMMQSENPLDRDYWNSRYLTQSTGWDLGEVSPPIKAYIDQIEDKSIRILIPGCGNTYEAEYLLSLGFLDITVIDIAPELILSLKKKFEGNKHVSIVEGDFFLHEGSYDLILEQTFFCAIDPSMRKKYAMKMNDLLAPQGKLVGLLFDVEFEKQGPPFGGDSAEYRPIFEPYFTFRHFERATNSFFKRAGTELFICLVKK